jgi:hypothetical protein
MVRTFVFGVVSFALVVCAAQARQAGSTVLLDKKDKLTDKDPGYKPEDKGKAKDVDQELVQQVTGNAHKVFTIKLTQGDKLVIEVKSSDLDPVVAVEDGDKKILAMNDDDEVQGDTTDSRLEWTVPKTAEYRIVVTCFENGTTGDFHLTVSKVGEKNADDKKSK